MHLAGDFDPPTHLVHDPQMNVNRQCMTQNMLILWVHDLEWDVACITMLIHGIPGSHMGPPPPPQNVLKLIFF